MCTDGRAAIALGSVGDGTGHGVRVVLTVTVTDRGDARSRQMWATGAIDTGRRAPPSGQRRSQFRRDRRHRLFCWCRRFVVNSSVVEERSKSRSRLRDAAHLGIGHLATLAGCLIFRNVVDSRIATVRYFDITRKVEIWLMSFGNGPCRR